MKIQLCFCKWDKYFSNAVRLITGEEFSHVGIGYIDKNNNYQVWEALNDGFVHTKNANYMLDNKYVEIVTISVKHVSEDDFLGIISKYEGKGYDWISIINILTMLIFKKSFLNIKGHRLLICSEAVALILKDLDIVDIGKHLNKDEDYIRPQEIFDYFKKKHNKSIKKK